MAREHQRGDAAVSAMFGLAPLLARNTSQTMSRRAAAMCSAVRPFVDVARVDQRRAGLAEQLLDLRDVLVSTASRNL
jgi:hypothetical protein